MRGPESKLAYGYFDSPIGPLLVAGDSDRLHLISFPTESRTKQPQADWCRDESLFVEAFRQLNAYFAGELTRFDLPLRVAGTAFQNKVWTALCDIPFAETISYGELASRIGKPSANRAVGGAIGNGLRRSLQAAAFRYSEEERWCEDLNQNLRMGILTARSAPCLSRGTRIDCI